jgi:small subunit ribosomal protein S16
VGRPPLLFTHTLWEVIPFGGLLLSVRIRLRRVGAKKQPSYRVVVADSRAPRDGRFIEVIGFYNPRTKPTTITINEEKARKWLSQGALPTESVASLLYRAGIVDMRRARYRKEGDVMPGAAAAIGEAALAAES